MKYEEISKLYEETGNKEAIQNYTFLVWDTCIEALEMIPGNEIAKLFNRDDLIIIPYIDFYFSDNGIIKVFFYTTQTNTEFVFEVNHPYEDQFYNVLGRLDLSKGSFEVQY